MPRKKREISEAERREYLRLVERANKRITRADQGQRAALDYILKETIRQKRFSRTIPTDRRVFNSRLKKVQDFLDDKITLKTGWKKAKQKALEEAGKVLRGEVESKAGKNPVRYTLTDDELKKAFEAYSDKRFAAALKKIKDKEKREEMKYTILDTVQARKNNKQKVDYIEIAGAVIAEEITAGEAIKEKTKGARKKRKTY